MGETQPDNGASEGVPVPSSYYSRPKEGEQLHQGELLRQVWEWVARYDNEGEVIGAEPRVHKLAVIATQECDLEQDFQERENDPMVETELRSILLCRAAPAEGPQGLREQHKLTSRFWELVRSNRAERYQYLAEVPVEADAAEKGHKPILVDFKSYFTVRTLELYRQIRATDEDSAALLTVLNVPWREHLQQRFVSYQARVGLPLDHFIPEGRRNELVAPRP